MTGTIVCIKHQIGLIAIRDNRDEITIAELLSGCNIEEGHTISGDLHSHGGTSLLNKTTGESISVFIEYIGLTKKQAVNILQKRR
ncbi:hypothetical protein [Xenorhabdus bovienii]|uniref:hypothetical protein n=1 Tax=Xenorhabdus bovienii TaxID=40576 RepID=UPI00237C7D2F|nr:hypothetical protein [Xenorhabdus bovienii]MDE1492883.1 hypothetical protein [Xenorhabdus bovienii]